MDEKVKFQINNKIEFYLKMDQGKPYSGCAKGLYSSHHSYEENIRQHLSKEEEIYGFYYDDNDVYMFTTYMIERVFENIPLYKLAFPKIIKRFSGGTMLEFPSPFRYYTWNPTKTWKGKSLKIVQKI